jgi:MFS transporter, DHA1 family, tetracycline resistance protein
MLGGAIGYTMFGLSNTGLLLWLGIPFLNLISLAWPAAQSMMSHEVSPSEQGQLQGAINSLRGLSGLIGPGLFTYVFSRAIGPTAWIQAPGMPFYLAAALVVMAIVMIRFIRQPAPATV